MISKVSSLTRMPHKTPENIVVELSKNLAKTTTMSYW